MALANGGEGRNRAANARLTVSTSLISLGISTKINYPNLTRFNPVTEGFTEDFTEGCNWQNAAAPHGSISESCAQFIGLLTELARIGFIEFGKALKLPPNCW